MKKNDPWDYFNYRNIYQEARARLAEFKRHGHATVGDERPKETIEYWTAWCAHANAVACLTADGEIGGEK